MPDADDKARLAPGDTARLMWSVRRYPAAGERMWVEVLERDGDRLVGRLKNWAVFVHLSPDAIVKFHIDDIIDCHFYDDDHEAVGDGHTGPGGFEYAHTGCNGRCPSDPKRDRIVSARCAVVWT